MEKKKPLKRNKNLQPLSRDHHYILLLCWKIRKGFLKKVAPKRMKVYSEGFFKDYILPHFKIEEEYLFPILGNEHEMVKRALADHRRLERLFRDEKQFERSLSLIEEELERHVRFEERELFQEIQKSASEEQLRLIAEHHKDEEFQESTEDEFWK